VSTVLSKYDNSINRDFTVNYKKSKFTHLPARDATFNGDLKRSSIHANCSFIENWTNDEDYIFWNINSLSSGVNKVHLYYTLPKSSEGTELSLEFMDKKTFKKIIDSHDPSLEGINNDRIERIESYTKNFKKISFGDLYFEKGISVLKLKTSQFVGNKSIDFRLLVLERK
tara:strand:- start:116 stop:625 length:510 start_codon:yes stop_codon:yes gene_type:complete